MGRALLSPDGRAPANTTRTEMHSLEARCARWRSGAGAESSAETPCPCVDASTSGRAVRPSFPQSSSVTHHRMTTDTAFQRGDGRGYALTPPTPARPPLSLAGDRVRSPERRPRAVHLVLRRRPLPGRRALSRAPGDVQASVSRRVPRAFGGGRARRARGDRISEKRRPRSVGAQRRPRHATGRDDVRGDRVRAGRRRDAHVGGGCGNTLGRADDAPEAATGAPARGHTGTIVQAVQEEKRRRRRDARRGRGDGRGETRNGERTPRGRARRRRRRGRRRERERERERGRGRFGFVPGVSSGFRAIVDERPIGKLGGVGVGDAPR